VGKPFGFHDTCRREAEKHIGPHEELLQRAQFGRLRVARLVVVHQFGATLIDDTRDVGNPNVLAPHADGDQHVEAGERRSARARADDLDLRRLFADDPQRVGERGADDDRGAMLVVVEDGNFHPLAQLALDVEALRRLDVLKVDAAEGRLQRRDVLDQAIGVELVEFDVEAIQTGEFLEEHRLALHHRLRRERPDVTEPEHRRAIGDHADQIAARREVERLARVAHDLVTGEADAGRIGERQIALRGHFQLAGDGMAVVIERGLFQRQCFRRVSHGVRSFRIVKFLSGVNAAL